MLATEIKNVMINENIRYCEDELLGMREELEFMRMEYPNDYQTMECYIEIDNRVDDFEDQITVLRIELAHLA